MTKIRFDNGITVTISDGWVQAPSPTLTAILDTLAATLPGYGSIPFILDEDFNIAQGLIRMVGVGKIVRRDKMPPFPDGLVNRRRFEDTQNSTKRLVSVFTRRVFMAPLTTGPES